LIGSLDRLAVDDRSRRRHLTAFSFAQPVAQSIVDKGPRGRTTKMSAARQGSVLSTVIRFVASKSVCSEQTF
jgi:hypothetical protein